MAIPVRSIGGRVQPKMPTVPKAGGPGWKAFTAQRWAANHPNAGQVKPTAQVKATPVSMDDTATTNAMAAFHAALAQLQAATPQVDAAAIYAPYRASQAVAGQLGTGMQTAVQGAGQAAQNQYAAGRDVAQQHAAQFGISAGGSANPTALQDTGTQALAQQTAAYAAAAPAAATQWQQLLERTAAARVADAGLQRQNLIASGSAQLAGNIPGAIQNEKQSLQAANQNAIAARQADRTFGFQQKTERFNEHLALSQLDAKGKAELRSFMLSAGKNATDAQVKAEAARIKRQALAQKTGNDAANLRVKQDALALKRRTTAATANGLKGVATVAKALTTTTTTKPGSKKVAKGWLVDLQAIDPDTGSPTGNVQKGVHLADARKAPTGFKIVGTPQTNWATVPTAGGSASLTARQWDTYMRSLLAQNPGRGAEVKAFLGPRPKK